MDHQQANNAGGELGADVRRAAWQGLAVAVVMLLYAGGIYGSVLTAIGEVAGLTSLDLWLLKTLRITCHLAAGLGIPSAVVCGLILTSRKGNK